MKKKKKKNSFASSVNFEGSKYILDFLRIFEMKKKKKKVKMNLPIFVVESVLDLSKILIWVLLWLYDT